MQAKKQAVGAWEQVADVKGRFPLRLNLFALGFAPRHARVSTVRARRAARADLRAVDCSRTGLRLAHVREVVRWSSTVSRSRARSFVAINHQSTLGSRRLQFSSL